MTYGLAHDTAPAWQAAQAADPTFISLYARDHPAGEDVADSLLMWYALRYRSDRLDAATIAASNASIPHRLAYFDALPFQISAPDFNFDGHVDAADYVVWRKVGGTPAQYEAWRASFNESGSSGADASVNATVPEPTTLMLWSFAVAVCSFQRSRAIEDRYPHSSTRDRSTNNCRDDASRRTKTRAGKRLYACQPASSLPS